ncbi:MAG: hypothetical protein CL391_00085 [Acidiferrobacteraceae bacterium]|nr:hypothetical protein [Acidiferrobacteraceae bacterium]
MLKSFLIAGCFAAAGLCPAAAFCAGLGTTLDRTRFPAEVLIVRGDLQRLNSPAALSPAEVTGLEGRIQSALTGLAWLAQEYGALTKSKIDGQLLQDLARSWAQRDFLSAEALADRLSNGYTLNSAIFSADRASAKDVERARELDLQLCQGCHTDRVGAEKILPAYRLKEMAAGMPSDEFLARLLSGVRGTSDTALANPLSLGDIRGLLRLYQEDAVD